MAAGAAILIYIIYTVYKMMNKKTNFEPSPNVTHTTQEFLNEEQKRALTFGAMLFYYRDEEILGFAPANNIYEHKEGLKNQWEINNPSEAKETVNELIALKRSTEFIPLIEHPSLELNKIQRQIAKELQIPINIVLQTKSAYAWDLCRAVSLTKWCYWVGYFTEKEAWSLIDAAAEKAAEMGKDWTDYTVSFLLGRTVQGFDLDDICVEAQQLLSSKGPVLGKVTDIDVYQRYSFKK